MQQLTAPVFLLVTHLGHTGVVDVRKDIVVPACVSAGMEVSFSAGVGAPDVSAVFSTGTAAPEVGVKCRDALHQYQSSIL